MFSEIELDNLAEGMVLAKPVLNKVGQVMIAQDATITNKHINVLKMWGINKVIIKTDNNGDDKTPYESVSIDRKKQQIKEALGWEIENHYIDDIIELAALSKYNVSLYNE